MTTTGLLFLDGPLNPYLEKPHARPPGYATFRRTPGGAWLTGREAQRHKGLRVWLNPQHGEMLLNLARQTGLELVWATTWLHEANTRIGPAIGLPELPVIEFPLGDLEPDGAGGQRWRANGNWKWSAVAHYAAGKPMAWLDDDLHDAGYGHARAAFDRARATTPTLLCQVDPRTGMTTTHLDQVRQWAENLPDVPA